MGARTKKCATCRRTLPLGNYHAHPRNKLGVQGSCKACLADRRRARAASDGAVADPARARRRKAKPGKAPLTAPLSGVGVLSEADHQAVWDRAVAMAREGDPAMVKLVLGASTPKAAEPAEDPEVAERRWMRYVLRAIREMRSTATTEWALQLLEELRKAGPEAAARKLGIEADELAI